MTDNRLQHERQLTESVNKAANAKGEQKSTTQISTNSEKTT